MKYKISTIYNGEQFEVPECIQRLDSKKNRAWQLRYGTWKAYSDGKYGEQGAKEALNAAVAELQRRIQELDAPTSLKRNTSSSKVSGLPLGISGPVIYTRKGKAVPELNLGVSIPRFGKSPTNKNVYIGTETTATDERFQQALEKAIAIREAAVEKYKQDATNAKRKFAGVKQNKGSSAVNAGDA